MRDSLSPPSVDYLPESILTQGSRALPDLIPLILGGFPRDVAYDGSRAPYRSRQTIVAHGDLSIPRLEARSLAIHRVPERSTHLVNGERRQLFHVSAGTCHLSIVRIAGLSHFRGERPFVSYCSSFSPFLSFFLHRRAFFRIRNEFRLQDHR